MSTSFNHISILPPSHPSYNSYLYLSCKNKQLCFSCLKMAQVAM